MCIRDSTKIERLVVERNGAVIFDMTKEENEREQVDGVRTPQAGFFVYDPTSEGYGSEALVTNGLNDLRFRLVMSGSDNVAVTLESIGSLGM